MFIVECIPLKRGLQKETLSYFTSQKMALGSLVSVPVRSKKVPALVIKITPLPKEKMAIKEASFSLKKLSALKAETLYGEEVMEAANDTANYYASNIGSILTEFTPQIILEEGHGVKDLKLDKKNRLGEDPQVLQSSEDDRLLEYKALIRECFAKNESVLICFPTIEEMFRFHTHLERGIEEYTYLFHSGLSKKEFKNAWKKAILDKHPILIIGTSLTLSLPRWDLGLLIIEGESSRFYKSPSRPYVDARIFAEKLARKSNIKFILGDNMLRVETLYRESIDELHRFPASKMRVGGKTECQIIDMKKETVGRSRQALAEVDEKRIFEVLGSEVKSQIEEALFNNEKILLFAARRGLSPITICGDCGTIVTCNHCGSPIILHRHKSKALKIEKGNEKNSEGHFLCHKCGERRDALESCRRCQSWNLKDLGIGIEKVEEKVRDYFPGASLFVMTRDNIKTGKAAAEMFATFLKTPRSILLGTEFALTYFTSKVERSAIISLDSLFAIPDYKINEKIFSLILNIKRLTRSILLIQTRSSQFDIFEAAARGDVIGFYREEIKKRELFNWPPFSTIIKISVEAKKDVAIEAMRNLVELLMPQELEVFPAFIPKNSGLHALTGLLRVKRETWPNSKIISLLKTLNPAYKIEVDPETIV